MFDQVVWLNKPRILSVFLRKMQDLIQILKRCNFLQLCTIFNVLALNYRTQSMYFIGIS